MEKKTVGIEYKRVVDEYGFWKLYFHTWNFNRPKYERFSEFELDSIAVMMCGDLHKSPLRSSQRKGLISRMNELGYKLTENNVHTRIVKPLLNAGIIYKSQDDITNGEYSVNPSLRKLQEYIKRKLEAGEKLNVNITYNIGIMDTIKNTAMSPVKAAK